jgi:repressor LexA
MERSPAQLPLSLAFELEFDTLFLNEWIYESLTGSSGTMINSRRRPGGGGGGDHTLTSRRRKILDFIGGSMERRGYSPSLREIADAVGLKSVSTVFYHLKVLEQAGYLTRDAGMPRTVVEKSTGPGTVQQIRPELPCADYPRVQPTTWPDQDQANLDAPQDALDISSQRPSYVPLVGWIAAGRPILAKEAIEDVFPLPRQLVGDGTLFLLRVRGDSMIDAAIVEGDWVVVRAQEHAENGEIVAAMIDGEATVKAFRRDEEKKQIWLLPRNSAYLPIPANDVDILGKVVTVLRSI